jgi:hypothetical protein
MSDARSSTLRCREIAGRLMEKGRWRHARLSPTSLASAATWLSRYERLWAESFDRLDDHLARLTSEQQLTSPTQTETDTETQTERGRP